MAWTLFPPESTIAEHGRLSSLIFRSCSLFDKVSDSIKQWRNSATSEFLHPSPDIGFMRAQAPALAFQSPRIKPKSSYVSQAFISSSNGLFTPLPQGRNLPSFSKELTTKFTISPDLKRADKYSLSSVFGTFHVCECPIGSFQPKPSDGL